MQLTYRGQAYPPSSSHTAHTLQTVYRGVPYAYTTQCHPSSLERLTYRGISEQSVPIPVIHFS